MNQGIVDAAIGCAHWKPVARHDPVANLDTIDATLEQRDGEDDSAGSIEVTQRRLAAERDQDLAAAGLTRSREQQLGRALVHPRDPSVVVMPCRRYPRPPARRAEISAAVSGRSLFAWAAIRVAAAVALASPAAAGSLVGLAARLRGLEPFA